MPTPASTCPRCGADATGPQLLCAYCGARLPAVAPADPAAPAAERFRALREHPDYLRLMAHSPDVTGLVAAHGCGAVFAVLFLVAVVAAGGVFLSNASRLSGPFALLFVVVPLIVVVGALLATARSIRRLQRLASEPVERRPALVVEERSTGEPGSPRHRVTLEFEGGERAERALPGRVASMITRGDVGVAYLKGDAVVDFQRVGV